MREAHVLEIIGKRPVGGVGTVMLNYQRHMNMERVQMDYLIFGEQEETFDNPSGHVPYSYVSDN